MWKSTSLNGWEYFIVWKDLGSSPTYANYVLFVLLLILILCMVMLCDNMIIELCELIRNMIWFDGLVLIWLWHGCGFKL